MRTKKLECEGCCDTFDGCCGDVRTVIVSRIGERNLCEAARVAFGAAGYVVSEVYAPKYVCDNNRGEPDEEILRHLGHGLVS